MSEPTIHHYVPQFFLKRWVRVDGRVYSWKRLSRDKVVMTPVAPKYTAYEPHLYSIENAPENEAQAVERNFFAKIDSDAAGILQFIESMPKNGAWNSDQRSAWSRFIMAQMLRLPADIAQLKLSVRSDWIKAVRELQPEYVKQREDKDPEAFADFLQTEWPDRLSRLTFEIITDLMTHSGIGQILNNLNWHVADMKNENFEMITTDRPIWATATFTESDAIMLMPVGRSLLFIAAPHQNTILRLLSRPRSGTVKNINRLLARHADQRAYSYGDGLTRLMEKNLAVMRHVTWAQRLATLRGHQVVPR